jgi:hypothetical protein
VVLEIRSRMALITTASVESGTSSSETRVPGFIMSGFDGETDVVAADLM